MNYIRTCTVAVAAVAVLLACLGVFTVDARKNLLSGREAPKRTLVVLDELSEQDKYKTFVNDLKAREHQVVIAASSDSSVELEKYGEWNFDNIVLFIGSAKQPKAVSMSDLPRFLEWGGNLIFGVSTGKLHKSVVRFASEIGVDLHPSNAAVFDYFSNVKGDPQNIITKKVVDNPYLVGKLGKNTQTTAVQYKGVSFDVASDNYLASQILSTEATGFSGVSDTSKPGKVFSSGTSTNLVVAIQARNNARVIVSGSTDLFSDDFFTSNPANQDFTSAISKWGFSESGVLRASNIRHHRADGSAPDPMLKAVQREDLPFSLYPDPEIARDSLTYRIKDNLTYAFDVHEFKSGSWVPFKADDVQLEFVMLDPYVRKTMKHNGKGTFSVTFQAPDSYGIYQFRVHYRRQGLSVLHFTTQVSLRPYKHDEYDRFIKAAFPYYSGVFTMMAGFFIFSVMFLFSKLD